MSLLGQRELVLSLKYSTIEACFSVPMLNLTMPNLPFLLAYATASLKWPSWSIGFIAALPHLFNCVQPLVSRALERRWSLHAIMRWGFTLSAFPWFFIGLCGKLPGIGADLGFAFLLSVATMANSVTSVAWSAAIAQVVPGRISGRYFGRRNLIFGAWTLVAVLTAGKIVDVTGNDPLVFSGIFALAGMMRLTGLLFLSKMKFPKPVMERREAAYGLKEIMVPLRDKNFRKYMLFVGMWGFFLNLGLPFYTVYMIRHLSVDVGQTILLSALGTVGGIFTLKAWGTLSDRFGSKPVQYVCCYVWIITGLIGWSITSPSQRIHLNAVFLLVGAATAGFQLAQFNLMLKFTPQGMGSLYIGVFLAVTSALTTAGPVLGGAILAILPSDLATIGKFVFKDFHFLFVISFTGCFMTLPLLAASHEPASEALHTVWRSMWRMRSFNPLLAVTNAAGFLLTPQGIMSLADFSIRSLRREAKRVMDVGSEVVSGGYTFLKDRR